MKSDLDRREDTFACHISGLSMDQYKKLPVSKKLDKLYVELLNTAEQIKAAKRKY